jgi:hypothetical protein
MLNRTTIITGLLSSLLACSGCSPISEPPEEIIPEPQIQQPSQAELAELSAALNDISPVNLKATVDMMFQSPAFSTLNSGIEFSTNTLPNWAQIDKSTGAIRGTPAVADVHAAYPFTLIATRGLAQVNLETSLTVQHKESLLTPDSLDFNATDFDGNARPLNNHLIGDLPGQVTFVQTHSIAPNNNEVKNAADETQSRYMPNLVALRDALLLFTPDAAQMPISVDVEVSLNGEVQGHYPMMHPYALYKSDFDGPEKIEYSHSAWSVELPWNLIRNGMSLKFTSNQGSAIETSGELIAANIDIGDATQMIIQTIRLGMLTHFDKLPVHFTLNNPWLAAADYFQISPVSKLVVASYADMTLNKTILANGTIYDTVSAGEGGIYSGDMRQNVAKAQVSTGINLANYGISSNNTLQSYPHLFKQVTTHHAWGNYQNGRQVHGLSGGNGIGTLYSTQGNEASHEWGHAYGLGHNPGSILTEDKRFQRHHADSGWGFIAHRKRLRSNIYYKDVQSSPEYYKGIYSYHNDPMSSGINTSRFSKYTFHTGYSALIMQKHLEQFPVADNNFNSGYKKWDESTGNYQQFDFPAEDQRLAPQQVGVPVATILGGYDPTGTNALIYPVFHGNYGNVFNLPAPDLSKTDGICWLTINNAANQSRNIALAGTRHNAKSINQLHINVAADYLPTSAKVICRQMGRDIELARTEFDGIIPPLPELAIVGQEAGYTGLRPHEMAQLSKAFSAISMDAILSLSSSMYDILASYSTEELTAGLTAQAKPIWLKYTSQQKAVVDLKLVLQQLMQKQTTMAEKAKQMRTELIANGIIAEGQSMPMDGSIIQQGQRYITAKLNADGYLTASMDAADAASWIVDKKRRIHLASQPSMCIYANNRRVGLASCENNTKTQAWNFADDGTLKIVGSRECVDYDGARRRLITYGCHAGANQQWKINTEAKVDNLLLELWAGSDLENLYQLLQH